MLSKPLQTVMLLLTLATASASINAQSANAELSRADVKADLQAWQAAGLDQFYRGENQPDLSSPQYQQAYQRYLQLRSGAGSDATYRTPAPLARADVKADLQAWQTAGLDRFYRGENGPDLSSPQYQQAYERYLQLRSGSDATYRTPAPLTRAEVKADLKNWELAGMGEFSRHNTTPNFESPEYRQAYETYLRLSSGE